MQSPPLSFPNQKKPLTKSCICGWSKKLETRGVKLEAGGMKLEVGGVKLEASRLSLLLNLCLNFRFDLQYKASRLALHALRFTPCASRLALHALRFAPPARSELFKEINFHDGIVVQNCFGSGRIEFLVIKYQVHKRQGLIFPGKPDIIIL